MVEKSQPHSVLLGDDAGDKMITEEQLISDEEVYSEPVRLHNENIRKYQEERAQWSEDVDKAHALWMQSTDISASLLPESPEKYTEFINSLTEEQRIKMVEKIQADIERHKLASENLKRTLEQEPVVPNTSNDK